jgi:hypothetical protein
MTWLVVPAYFPTCTQQSVNQYNTTIIFCLAKKGPHLFLAEKPFVYPRLMSFLLWNNRTTGRWHSSCDGQKMNLKKNKIHFHIFLNWEREDKHEQFGLVEPTFKFKGIDKRNARWQCKYRAE